MSDKLMAEDVAEHLENEAEGISGGDWYVLMNRAAKMLRGQESGLETAGRRLKKLENKIVDKDAKITRQAKNLAGLGKVAYARYLTISALECEIAKLKAEAVDFEAIDRWCELQGGAGGNWWWYQDKGALICWRGGTKPSQCLDADTLAEASRTCRAILDEKEKATKRSEEVPPQAGKAKGIPVFVKTTDGEPVTRELLKELRDFVEGWLDKLEEAHRRETEDTEEDM